MTETDLSKRLEALKKELVGMSYSHPEGGKYVYLFFLCLTRRVLELPLPYYGYGWVHARVGSVQGLLNALLCEDFTRREEMIFHKKQSELVFLLDRVLIDLNRRNEDQGIAAA